MEPRDHSSHQTPQRLLELFIHFHQGAISQFGHLNSDPWKFNILNLCGTSQHLEVRHRAMPVDFIHEKLGRQMMQDGDFKPAWKPSGRSRQDYIRLLGNLWTSLWCSAESNGSYCKFHCKAVSREFGSPGMSNITQLIFKIITWTWPVCFPQQLWIESSRHLHLRDFVKQNKKNKTKEIQQLERKARTCAELEDNFSDANEIFSNLSAVVSLWQIWLKHKMFIKEYMWPFLSPPSSNQSAFCLSHTHIALILPCLISRFAKKFFFFFGREKSSKPHLIEKQETWRQMRFTLVQVECLSLVECKETWTIKKNDCSDVNTSPSSERFPQGS